MPAPSLIETALYGEWSNHVCGDGEVGNHCVLEFSWLRDQIGKADVVRLAVAPWENEYGKRTVAEFSAALVTSVVQLDHDPEHMALPWGIVGFICDELPGDLWSFHLNCWNIRLAWCSKWPTIGEQEGG